MGDMLTEINFHAFEEEFKILPTSAKRKPEDPTIDKPDGPSETQKQKQKPSLLDHTRLRNMAICTRKLPEIPNDKNRQELIRSINNLDIQVLNADAVELLQRMVPNEEEIKAYRKFDLDRKDYNELTEEDQIMRHFSYVKRFEKKLHIMAYMASFEENVALLKPQIAVVTEASRKLKGNPKIKKILEIILAFGNYMNSSKKGPCYGFKLSSLDSLTISKSGKDKSRHLLHYIVDMVNEKYPDLKAFYTELAFVKEAAQYSIENILTENNQLEKDNAMMKTELDNRKDDLANLEKMGYDKKSQALHNTRLQEFYNKSSDVTSRVKKDTESCQNAYKDCIEFFGESTSSKDQVTVNTFFGYFVRFVAAWKTAETENERRRKQLEAEENKKAMVKNKANPSRPTDKVSKNEYLRSEFYKHLVLLKRKYFFVFHFRFR